MSEKGSCRGSRHPQRMTTESGKIWKAMEAKRGSALSGAAVAGVLEVYVVASLARYAEALPASQLAPRATCRVWVGRALLLLTLPAWFLTISLDAVGIILQAA